MPSLLRCRDRIMALNHIPASTWRRVRDRESEGRASGLSLGLEHGGVERLARRLARPDHELKGGEIALACLERRAEQALTLAAAGLDDACQHLGVTVHDQAVRRPKIEVTDPHLLIDLRNQQLDFRSTALGHLELERTGEMQRLDI